MAPTSVYHLKIEDINPHSSLARCNSNANQHWRMYSQRNFIQGKTFNVKEHGFIEIQGNRCKRCWKLYYQDNHK